MPCKVARQGRPLAPSRPTPTCWVYARAVQGEQDPELDPYNPPRRTFGKPVVVIVLVVVAIGGYALYRHNQVSRQTQAMRAFCVALAGATDQANVNDPGLRISQKLVDKDGRAVGGQVSSETIGLEAAISGNDIPEATAYIQRLRADCTSDGYATG
jgi:hypothetical protein